VAVFASQAPDCRMSVTQSYCRASPKEFAREIIEYEAAGSTLPLAGIRVFGE